MPLKVTFPAGFAHKSSECPVKDWPTTCVLCKHYSCNWETVKTENEKPNLVIENAGKGVCNIHEREETPLNACDKFDCKECGTKENP